MRRLALLLLLLLVADVATARIGGGDSYSGDSSSCSSSSSSDYSSDSSSDYSSESSSSRRSSGGGGSGDGGEVSLVLFLFMGFLFVAGALNASGKTPELILTAASSRSEPAQLAPLRHHDANFSEIVFTDFCYSLFARVYEALGRGRVDDFAPYVSAPVREGLKQHAPRGLTSIDGIVIGSFSIIAVRGLYLQQVEVDVQFEANYSAIAEGVPRRWYVREVWTLTRARDLLSPPPEKARAEHCPKCGAALETRTDGACLHCGTVVRDGSFNWFLLSIRAEAKSERPPRLGGGGGVEPGLDKPTVLQAWIGREMRAFESRHPDFSWPVFEERVYRVATELQDAWTSRDWRRARPLETGALFQMHRYWIDEYERQDVVNRVDGYSIDKVEVAKVTSDAFYDAITVRLYASGRDYTVDTAGNVIGGSSQQTKMWSEYWTFVRGRAASANTRVCPNCGGELASGQTAVCEYCGGTITSGEFPWVLSRIEQDEAYRG